MGWLYFAIMGLMAILLGAFGSVFNTYSGLYLAKDNDLLLSMPIPVRYPHGRPGCWVCTCMGLMYSGVVMLPAIIVYWATVSAAPLHPAGGRSVPAADLPVRHGYLLPAGLGGSKIYPEAKAQEHYYGTHRPACWGLITSFISKPRPSSETWWPMPCSTAFM